MSSRYSSAQPWLIVSPGPLRRKSAAIAVAQSRAIRSAMKVLMMRSTQLQALLELPSASVSSLRILILKIYLRMSLARMPLLPKRLKTLKRARKSTKRADPRNTSPRLKSKITFARCGPPKVSYSA